jgi:hypothetical protein
MEEAQALKQSYQIVCLMNYLFIIFPVLIVLMTTCSMLKFKNKAFQDAFAPEAVSKGLASLFLLLVGVAFILPYGIFKLSIILKKSMAKVKNASLATKVIIPLFMAKAPAWDVILKELIKGSYYIVPIIIVAAILSRIKKEEDMIPSLIAITGVNLVLLLIVYRFYTIYCYLYSIRITIH